MSSIIKIIESIASADSFMGGLPNYLSDVPAQRQSSQPSIPLATPVPLDFLLGIDPATITSDALTRTEDCIQPQQIIAKIENTASLRKAVDFI